MSEQEIGKLINDLIQVRASYKEKVVALGLQMFQADSGKLFCGDILAAAVANSLLRLSKNLTRYIDDRDFIMSAAMIRMMVDSVITYFGAWQVNNPDDYMTSLMGGGEISDHVDRSGRRLSYSCLARNLAGICISCK